MIISPIIIKVERKVTEAKIQDNLDILLFKCFEVFVIESMFPIIVAKINRSASRVRLSPALFNLAVRGGFKAVRNREGEGQHR